MNINFYPLEDQLNDITMRCPKCGEDLVHLDNRVELIKGLDDHAAAHAGYKGRGDVLKVGFYCEGRCKFNLCFGEHKGNIFTYWEAVKSEQGE